MVSVGGSLDMEDDYMDDDYMDDDDEMKDDVRKVVWSGTMPVKLLTLWYWLGGRLADIPEAQRDLARIEFEDDEGYISITLPQPRTPAEEAEEARKEADRARTKAWALAEQIKSFGPDRLMPQLPEF